MDSPTTPRGDEDPQRGGSEEEAAAVRETAQPGFEHATTAEEVQLVLEAGGDVPRPLPDAPEPPSVLIESAEGVTTYAGFNGDPRSKKAKAWAAKELRERMSESLEDPPASPADGSAPPA